MKTKFEEELQEQGLSCILFDGRKDDNKVLEEVDGKHFHP